MGRVAAIITLLVAIVMFVVAGVGLSKGSTRLAEVTGTLGFLLFVTALVLFAFPGKPKTAKAAKA